MLDCGEDWLTRLQIVAPASIVLTHAHLDHAGGLAGGAPCPVYAPESTLNLLYRYPIADRRALTLRKSTLIAGLQFEAFPVQHSIRAPAVGYRISNRQGSCFFYLPDVADLPNPIGALQGIDLYIGDGASIRRSMVRNSEGIAIGHASVRMQLDWCKEAAVSRAIFTHCGSAIVRAPAKATESLVQALGAERGIEASIACDGDQVSLA